MGNCKDCRFWYPTHVLSRTGWKTQMICGNMSVAFDAILDPEEDGNTAICVRVLDDSGLDAWLMTAPDFGCVNFEAKNDV